MAEPVPSVTEPVTKSIALAEPGDPRAKEAHAAPPPPPAKSVKSDAASEKAGVPTLSNASPSNVYMHPEAKPTSRARVRPPPPVKLIEPKPTPGALSEGKSSPILVQSKISDLVVPEEEGPESFPAVAVTTPNAKHVHPLSLTSERSPPTTPERAPIPQRNSPEKRAEPSPDVPVAEGRRKAIPLSPPTSMGRGRRRTPPAQHGRTPSNPPAWDWPHMPHNLSASSSDPVRRGSMNSPERSRSRSRSVDFHQKASFTDFSLPIPFEGQLVKLIVKVDSQVLAQFEFLTTDFSTVTWTGCEEIHLVRLNPDICFELLGRELKGCPAATFAAAVSNEASLAKVMSSLNDNRNWNHLGKATASLSTFLNRLRTVDGTESLSTLPITLTSNGVTKESQISARIDMLGDELLKHSGKPLPSTSTRIRPDPLRTVACADLTTLAFTFDHLDNPKSLTGAQLAEVHQSWNRIRLEFQELCADMFTNFLFLIYPKAAQLYEPMCNMQWGKKWIEFMMALTDKLPNNPRKMDGLFVDAERLIYDLGREHGLLRFPREFYLYAGDAMCRVVVRVSASFNQMYDAELTRSGFHSLWSGIAHRLWKAHQAQQPTEAQGNVVGSTWKEVQENCSSLAKFGMEFYRLLFWEHPETMEFFATTDMDGQMTHLGHAVAAIVHGFGAPHFEAKVKQLAISHLNHMIRPKHFGIVGSTLLKTIEWALNRPLTAEETAAWVTIFTQIATCVSYRAKVAEELEGHAIDWLEQMAQELHLGAEYVQERTEEIRAEILATGSYTHTYQELSYGAKVGWRNAAKCPGRIQWNNMVVRDMRHLSSPDAIFNSICKHLKMANDHGVIKTTMSVFPVKPPGSPLGVRIWNDQVIRYAGYQVDDDTVLGDPARIPLTSKLIELGWVPPNPKGPFDILPLAIECPGHAPRLYQLPSELIPEVQLEHPQYPWFKDLHLKWYTIPMISGFAMEIGGLTYSCFPFNGWYMSSEIGRNLVERYGMGKMVALRLGVDTTNDRSLWVDQVSLIVHQAVMYSFTKAGVSMVDHNTCSKQWLTHAKRELRLGREVNADWAWVVPPLGSQAITWHQTMRYFWMRPAYGQQVEVWRLDSETDEKHSGVAIEKKRPRLIILFGSETGKAESFANTAANRLVNIFEVSIMSLDEADWGAIASYSEKAVLVVTSTFGQGEPPSNAKMAQQQLSEKTVDFSGIPFAVFALGSRMYPEFAAFGKWMDQTLGDLGGARLLSVGLADELLGQDSLWKTWSHNFYTMLSRNFHGGLIADSVEDSALEVHWVDEKSQDPIAHHTSHPIPGTVSVNEELMLNPADKSVRKIYFKLESEPIYEEGDHVSVWPENLPSSVDQMLSILQLSGDKTFCMAPKKGKLGKPLIHGSCSIRDALTKVFDLQLFNYSPGQLATVLRALERHKKADGLRKLITELESNDREVSFLTKDSILDFCCTIGDLLLAMCPQCPFECLAPTLLPLQPRRYSISTGPKAHPGVVGVTVAVVNEVRSVGDRYVIKGVCSNYLASRQVGDRVYVKLHKANFQLPRDGRDIILVGSGTGIAPFRAFLAERKEALNAEVKTGSEAVLFFGCRNRQEDFLYKSEIQEHLGSASDPVFEVFGPTASLPLPSESPETALHEFHIAPSRETSEKTYVQHLILAHGTNILERLIQGASFYICGDVRMAQDVKAALVEVAVQSGNYQYEQAISFFEELSLKGQYQTDVWGVTMSVDSVTKEAREIVKNRARDWVVSVASGKVIALLKKDYDVS